MTFTRFAKATGLAALFAGFVLAGSWVTTTRAHDNDDHDTDYKVRLGFEIAPVPLNLHGKDRELVGLGSYIVNAVADCNGCHSAGPQTEYTQNPYLLAPVFKGKKKVNPATYLGGGDDFGQLVPGSADIVSRNLTPDKSGLPEGGHTFGEFYHVMRTGVDLDHLHPTCTGAPNAGCIPFPFNGALLQVMPWPAFQDMTDHDLRAIYEYLSAVPCIAGPASGVLHNDCH